MPVYDYKCLDHGLFFGLQTIEQYDQPQACPQCGMLSARIIRLPPNLLLMDRTTKQAVERNERAQNEPLMSSALQRSDDTHHRKQCGCDKPNLKAKLFYTAKGEKMFPSARPWMISH